MDVLASPDLLVEDVEVVGLVEGDTVDDLHLLLLSPQRPKQSTVHRIQGHFMEVTLQYNRLHVLVVITK